MKKIYLILMLMAVFFIMAACDKKDDSTDKTPPTIGGDPTWVNPVDCSVYHRGENLLVRYELSDNEELGSYEIEIHNNFQPHTHSAVTAHCQHEANTATVYPWAINESFEIPAGQKTFSINKTYTIPDDRDEGDYHLEIRVTDRAGWTTEKSIDIKIKDIPTE